MAPRRSVKRRLCTSVSPKSAKKTKSIASSSSSPTLSTTSPNPSLQVSPSLALSTVVLQSPVNVLHDIGAVSTPRLLCLDLGTVVMLSEASLSTQLLDIGATYKW